MSSLSGPTGEPSVPSLRLTPAGIGTALRVVDLGLILAAALLAQRLVGAAIAGPLLCSPWPAPG